MKQRFIVYYISIRGPKTVKIKVKLVILVNSTITIHCHLQSCLCRWGICCYNYSPRTTLWSTFVSYANGMGKRWPQLVVIRVHVLTNWWILFYLRRIKSIILIFYSSKCELIYPSVWNWNYLITIIWDYAQEDEIKATVECVHMVNASARNKR